MNFKNKNKTNIRSVLFDMDGVIVESVPIHTKAAQNVLRKYGLELTDEEYRQHFAGRTDEAGFAYYLELQGADELDLAGMLREKAAEYAALSTGELKPFPGVVEFIQSLAGSGVTLALVTGSIRPEAELALTTFKVRQLFRELVTADDIVHSKPHPEGYLRGLRALDALPAHTVVIEDAPDGVYAAKRAGMRCVGVTNTCSSRELAAATVVTAQLAPGCLDELLPIEPLFDICPSFWQPPVITRQHA